MNSSTCPKASFQHLCFEPNSHIAYDSKFTHIHLAQPPLILTGELNNPPNYNSMYLP